MQEITSRAKEIWSKEIFDKSFDPMLVFYDDKFIDCNSSALKFLGLKNQSELIDKSLLDISTAFQPDGKSSLEDFNVALKQVRTNGTYRSLWTLQLNDGDIKPVELTLTDIHLSDKDIIHVIWRDLSELNEINKQLKESENLYKSLIRALPDMTVFTDTQGIIRFVSEKALQNHRCKSFDDIIGTHITQWIVKEEHPILADNLKHRLSGITFPYVYTLLRKDGTTYKGETSTQPFLDSEGNTKGLITVVRDVSDRIQLEHSLQKSESELEIRNSIANIFLFSDEKNLYDEVLNLLLNVFNTDFGLIGYIDANNKLIIPTFTNKIWDNCTVKDKTYQFDIDAFTGFFRRNFDLNRTIWQNGGLEVPKGHIKLRNALSSPMIFKGVTIGLVTLAHRDMDFTQEDANLLENITNYIAPILKMHLDTQQEAEKRKVAESRIRESEEKYKKLFDEASDAILVAEMDTGLIVDCNLQAVKLFKRSKEEMLMMHQRELHPEVELLGDKTKTFVEQTNSKNDSIVETKIIDKEGNIRDVAIKAVRIETKGRKLLRGSFRDITETKKAEEEIRLKAYLLDNANDSIILLDMNGNFKYVNDIACKSYGYDYAEFINMNLKDLDTEDNYKLVKERIKKLINDGFINFEGAHKRKDGTTIPVDINSQIIESKGEKLILSIIRDISERKLAEKSLRESREQYMLAIKGTNDGIWDWDLRTNTLYLSERWKQMLGFEDNELPNNMETFWQQLHPEDHVRVQKAITSYLSGEVPKYEMEFRMLHKNNSFRWILAKGEAIRDENGKPYRMAGSHSDITPRKEYENQIFTAKEQAEMANRAKSAFLANMSHEIRTPMNAILGFAELLKYESLDDKQVDYVTGIISGGKSLMILINDILDLSKIEAGRMQISYEPVYPEVLFNELNAMFVMKTNDKGIEFKLDIDPGLPKALILDETRIRQILFNLIGNAIKFTHKGSVIVKVDKKYADQLGSKLDLIFTVSDTGIGIPKEQHQAIFEAFRQQEKLNIKKYGGTGLGLTITKRLVEMMNGVISLESEYGKGSTFIVKIPEVKVATISQEITEDINLIGDIVFKKSKILLVEDIEANRVIVKNFLEPMNLIIYEAFDGIEAVTLAREIQPDLILMDIQMPEMDGIEASKIIKSTDTLSNIPIIALTAYAMKEDEKEISKYCDGFLPKPITKNKLTRKLMDYLPYQTDNEYDVLPLSDQVIDDSEKSQDYIATINNILIPEWKKIKSTLIIDQILNFAETVEATADKFDAIEMKNYGESLKSYVYSFNIEKIIEILPEFQKLVSREFKDNYS